MNTGCAAGLAPELTLTDVAEFNDVLAGWLRVLEPSTFDAAQARRGLATFAKLGRPAQAATNLAFRNGELSPQQADAITDAASGSPESEAALLAAARTAPLARLKEKEPRSESARGSQHRSTGSSPRETVLSSVVG